MALLETYGATNLKEIMPQTTYTIPRGTGQQSGIWGTFSDEITEYHHVYTGMTRTAALACQTALNDPANGIKATVRWVDGRMYETDVTLYNITSSFTPIGG